MENDQIDIPHFYICPISLQIMKDPVTAITGITYERESIERWLSRARDPTCPVTNQSLPADSDLTPNHMLRRLIQAWSTANKSNGVDRIPTPKSTLDGIQVQKLIKDVFESTSASSFVINLKKIDGLVGGNERNRKSMMEANVGMHMLSLIIRGYKQGKTIGLEEALRILNVAWNATDEMRALIDGSCDAINSLTWVLLQTDVQNLVILKTLAILALKKVVEIASSNQKERLNLDFFKAIVQTTREKTSEKTTKASLQILIDTCPWGRNRNRIVESGGVFELIEIELGKPDRKKMTELVFCVLASVCYCAEGREQILQHGCGIALLAKRLLRVSHAADDQIMQIIALICKFSATHSVLMEMLKVGAVSKLCMVLQADCEKYLKNKAREVLRMHSNVWNNSPCIAVYLLTRYPR